MKDLDKSLKKLTRIYAKTTNLFSMGKFDESLEYFKKNESHFNNSSQKLGIEAEQLYCQSLTTIALINSYRGDLVRSFEIVKSILKIAEENNDDICLLVAMNCYGRHHWLYGDLTQALKYFDRAIELQRDFHDGLKNAYILNSVMMAVRIAVMKGELEIAREYFKQIEIDQIEKSKIYLKPLTQTVFYKQYYSMAKALLLKSSARFRDKALAEDLFKTIYEDESNQLNLRLLALVDLCELLLNELWVTNDINIVDEIKPLIAMLLDFAKTINNLYFVIEANTIRAKLALITFEINNARRFLTQAQRMAERHGYTKLAIEIAETHDDLIKQLDNWDYLEKIDAPMSKRMELANLGQNLNQINRVQMATNQVSEKNVTIYKERKECLVCLGVIEGFDIYICSNCSSIYCKTCAQALIEMENMCWSCESPIDKTKPITFLEKEKIDIKDNKDTK